jgi:DNA-binding NarL/FixJ family response regulator
MNRSLKKHRIVIIEPSQIVQQGIKSLLSECREFQVIRCYPNYQSFKEETRKTAPDMILINPILVDFHKQFVVKSFFPEYPKTLLVAILYSYVDPETTDSFDGFIDIYDDYAQIVKKLRKTIVRKMQDEQPLENVELSDREKEILVFVAKGCINKEIAEKLNLSVHTVISHRKNIARKTGIKTVSGMTIYALFNHLILQENLS